MTTLPSSDHDAIREALEHTRWYSERPSGAIATRSKAESVVRRKRRAREAERLPKLGADPEWVERMLEDD